MEFFWTGYIEILKILLSWPPIALLMLIIIIFNFKDQVASLLGRLTSGKILGNEFKATPINQIEEASHFEKDSLLAQAKSVDVAETTSITNPTNTSNDQSPAIQYIVSHPQETLIEYQRVLRHLNFEILFNRIFGTQIELLEKLSTQPTNKFSVSQLYHFYTEHQRRAASTEYQLRDYLNFLVVFQTLDVSQIENNNMFSISEFGLEFLSYIKANYKENWYSRNL